MHVDELDTSDATSDQILVVLNTDDPGTTLRAVVREIDAAAAEFHILLVFPTAEYEERRHARIDAGVPGPYTIDHLTEDARRIAQRVGREYLGPDAEGFEAMGAVGDKHDYIRKATRKHDYSRVYVAEQSHSIWQRLLGVEDLSTKLTRTLPDVVSVVSGDDVVTSTTEESDADAVFDPGAEPTTRSRDT